ncbi:MAG: prolipoprotein diacylglyceryl transferase [Clostridia bacterium]|nr:prolipoprotein diacylglyceryl transferase [Clostridia bacterium]
MANIITFPKLGFSLNLSPVAFTVGTKEVYWYALIILFGFLMGIFLVSFDSEKRGLSKDNVLDIALWGMVSGVICARIYYVLFSLDEFRGDWLGIFRIWEGGIAIYGAIIGAVLSTFIYCKKKKLNIFNTFDVCCVGLLLGQAIGRWGNFTNCEVFGRPTDFLLGMSINGNTPVHPLFFYESMWSLVGVILLCVLRNKKKKNGQIFFGYILWYSAGRLVLEGMRDTRYILYVIPDTLGISQLVAALLIILSVGGLIYVTKSDKECFKA